MIIHYRLVKQAIHIQLIKLTELFNSGNFVELPIHE